LKPVFTGKTTAVTRDALSEGLVDAEGVISEPVAPGSPGKILLNGTHWKAESDETLNEGEAVIVTGQKSLTLIVKSK
jgi:membrane protein implicated in regulation of membrane protease activity